MTFFVSCRIMPSMLDPEHIPIGNLKQAFDLKEQDIQRLLSALPPDGIFPDTLWRRAYKSFWFGPMESYLVVP